MLFIWAYLFKDLMVRALKKKNLWRNGMALCNHSAPTWTSGSPAAPPQRNPSKLSSVIGEFLRALRSRRGRTDRQSISPTRPLEAGAESLQDPLRHFWGATLERSRNCEKSDKNIRRYRQLQRQPGETGTLGRHTKAVVKEVLNIPEGVPEGPLGIYSGPWKLFFGKWCGSLVPQKRQMDS